MTVIKNAMLFIDLGNSSTEITVALRKEDNPLDYIKVAKTIPNRYAKTAKHAQFLDPVNEDNSWRFVLKGEHEFLADHEKVIYDGGKIVGREYTNIIRPTAIDNKFTSTAALLALNSSFMFGFKLVAQATGVPLEELEVEWSRVAVLLPPAKIGLPGEKDSGSSKMANVVKSIKEIEFIKPDIKKAVTIKENAVIIASEGHVGFLGVMFSPNGMGIREGYEGLMNSNNLVLDIGAGTTDIIQIIEATVVESSKFTIDVGGNNVAHKLGQLLVDSGLPKKKDSQLQNAVVTGKIRDGGKVIDIRDQLMQAKEHVADMINSALNEYLESTGIDAREIENLLVIGGGSSRVYDDNGNEIGSPISEMLVSRIKQISPNIEMVKLPKEVTSDGSVREVSPRKLNIRGAVILGCNLDRKEQLNSK